MSDRALDASTGDLQNDAKGGFVDGDVLANKILMSNSIDLGSWEGDPTMGNRYRELERTTMPIAKAKLPVFIKAAVKWLLDSGELESVDVKLEEHDLHTLAWEADYNPPGGGEGVHVGPNLIQVGG